MIEKIPAIQTPAHAPGGREVLMRAATYARVSTLDQNCELQLREIRQYTDRQSWEIREIYQGHHQRREIQPASVETG